MLVDTPKLCFAHGQRDGDLFERSVARALADAVDRAFHLTRARPNRRQRIGHGQSQIVVAMRAQSDAFGDRQDVRARAEHRAVFLRHGVADGVGQIDDRRAGLHGDAAQPRTENRCRVRLASSAENSTSAHVLAAVAHLRRRWLRAPLRASCAACSCRCRSDVARKMCSARMRRRLERVQRGINIFLPRARQRRHAAAAHFAGHRAHAFKVAGEAIGKPLR